MQLRYFLISIVILLSFSCQNKETKTEALNQSDPIVTEVKDEKSKKDLKKEIEKRKKARENNQQLNKSFKTGELNGQKKATKLYRGSDGKVVLPDASSLVSKEQMAKWLKVPLDKLQLIEPSAKDGNSSSCFYKWEDPDMANTAVLIQLMRNSVEDEVPDWPYYFIKSKIESGEQQMTVDGEKSYLFKPYNEFGTDGAYNAAISKWFWRIENEAIVMIAFNTYFSEKFKSEVVSKIGKEIMEKI
jgi:hypothetical protein